MQAFDFYAVVYCGEVYCVEHLPEGVRVTNEDVRPIFANAEWDVAPVCYECGKEHRYMSIIGKENQDGE